MKSEPSALRSHLRPILAAIGALLAIALLVAPAASAADKIFWANVAEGSGDSIAYANLDGSGGGGDLNITGAVAAGPIGLAIDMSTGRIYWSNYGADSIAYANVDGSGGGGLFDTGTASIDTPFGVAIDPTTRKIYWTSEDTHSIGVADLDGGSAEDLNILGGPVTSTLGGLALDLAGKRVYWMSTDAVGFANLDGSGGGGSLDTTGGGDTDSFGGAIDPVARRIYWVNYGDDTISYAALDGSGGALLDTTGASVENPQGIAVDHEAGRVYWANESGQISYADLDGGNGGDLDTSGATLEGPASPALLKAPRATGAPTLTGASTPGSILSCSEGSWAADQPGAYLYQSPRTISYGWTRDGVTVAGAGSSTYAASTTGVYRCIVTAANYAGSAQQTSAPLTVAAAPAAPATPEFKLRVAPRKAKVKAGGKVTFKARVRNVGNGPAEAKSRICLKLPKKAMRKGRKALRAPRCKKLGAIEPGANVMRRFKVKVTWRAHGSYSLRFTLGKARAKATLKVKLKRRHRPHRRSTHR